MGTFTGLFYGSGQKRGEEYNIISAFEETLNTSFSQASKMTDRTVIKVEEDLSEGTEVLVTDTAVRSGPGALGLEVRLIADKTVNHIITWLAHQTDEVHHVNLAGFSRGAVTCFHIAHRLKEKENDLKKQKIQEKSKVFSSEEETLLKRLEQLKIHIFALDPVAGLSDKSHREGKAIPDNVATVVKILQLDEMRREFKPQDLSREKVMDPSRTQVSHVLLYGNHSDSTKIKEGYMDSGPRVVWNLLYAFFKQKGTPLRSPPSLVVSQEASEHTGEQQSFTPAASSKELLTLFMNHHTQRAALHHSGAQWRWKKSMPIFRRKRKLNENLAFYVKDPSFFLNQLEREVFKLSYPCVFNYFFEQNQQDPRFPGQSDSQRGEVEEELRTLGEEHKELFERLRKKKFFTQDEYGTIKVKEPTGNFCLESLETVKQFYPSWLTYQDKSLDEDLAKLGKLEQEIYRQTFCYEREKPGWNVFTPREGSEYASALREQVQAIMKDSPTQPQEKYKKIIEAVQSYYHRVAEANRYPDLVVGLRTVLKEADQSVEITFPNLSVIRKGFVALFNVVLEVIKTGISLVGGLLWIGGGILSTVGLFFEDFGARIVDILGDKKNLRYYLLVGSAAFMYGLGGIFKARFGLKPLTDALVEGLSKIQDGVASALYPLEVKFSLLSTKEGDTSARRSSSKAFQELLENKKTEKNKKTELNTGLNKAKNENIKNGDESEKTAPQTPISSDNEGGYDVSPNNKSKPI